MGGEEDQSSKRIIFYSSNFLREWPGPNLNKNWDSLDSEKLVLDVLHEWQSTHCHCSGSYYGAVELKQHINETLSICL